MTEDVLAEARAQLARFDPPDAEAAATHDRFVAFLDAHPRAAHLRSCASGHLTASALVVDAGRARGLLVHHRKLGRWLQPGGHADGDADLARVALREAREESGVAGLALWRAEPVDLDVHAIPARPGEPAHLHYDARFVVLAPRDAVLTGNHESHEVRWATPGELDELGADASTKRLFARGFAALMRH